MFFRPPNSDLAYISSIEDSIDLVIHTGISDIIITLDFNYSMIDVQLSNTIRGPCEPFSLTDAKQKPIHFTERSSTFLATILTSKENHLILNGVGHPFLS